MKTRHIARFTLAFLTTAILAGSAIAAERLKPGDEAAFAIPRMSAPPKIDGVLDPVEWREAVAVSGVVNTHDDLLVPRPTTFFLAWDPGHLYFACRAYLRPNDKPSIRDGRSQGNAYCFDDGLELLFKPMGRNVSDQNQRTEFRCFLNCLGNLGDLTRLAVGQQLKNWAPGLQTAVRITEPGTAPNGFEVVRSRIRENSGVSREGQRPPQPPNSHEFGYSPSKCETSKAGGGSWWELEVSGTTADFELVGDNRAGDSWRFMFGFNHLPGWMQARVPAIGSYFTPDGKCSGTLVENTPAVQFTMDSLSNVASDGTAALRIKAFNPTQAEAQLAVDVNVAGKIAKSETLRVPAGNEVTFSLSDKLPADVKSGDLRVSVRQGDRVLLAYKTLFEVGKDNWMLAPVQPRDPAKFAFEAKWNPVRGTALVKADTYYLPDPKAAQSLRYRIVPEAGGAGSRIRENSEGASARSRIRENSERPSGGGDQDTSRILTNSATSDRGEAVAEGNITNVAEWYFQDVIRLPNLKPGKYTIEGSLVLADGKTLGPLSAAIQKEDEARAFPEWWGKKFGNIERVLPPFTAMARQGDEVNCWGRTYTLNALGLPKAIASQQAAVLAAPARVVVVVDGREESVPMGTPAITDAKDWRVRFEGTATGAGLTFTARGWIEQDGMVYTDLTYQPADGKPVKLDALRIEYPLSEEDAECLVCVGPGANFASKSTLVLPKESPRSGSRETSDPELSRVRLPEHRLWSTLDTGRTGSNMKLGSFYPAVWIGSERRGLLWWADHDQGWFPDDSVPAHEAVRISSLSPAWERAGVRGATAVVLRNNIIGRPVELTGPRTLSFSYMASPFRPLPKGWRMIAATDDGTFFQPFRAVRKDSKTGEKLWDPARGNINWIHPESRYPEEWSALWAEQKKQADALVHQRRPFDLYGARTGVSFQHMSFQLIGYGHKSIQTELYDYFGDEWFPGGHDTWNETYTDYAMYLFERAYREGGVVSTYWDLTFPILTNSLLSGLSYRLPDGRVQPGYNGWNCRRFFMRLHALQQDHGLNPGCTGAHSTNAYLFPVLPWIDAILDGERDWHLDTTDMDWIDYYPVERMRSMSTPHNWGAGICWMSNYTSANPDKIKAAKTNQAGYVWMHDSWLNPYLPPGPTVMPPAVLDWGINSAETVYHPYWRSSSRSRETSDRLPAGRSLTTSATTSNLVSCADEQILVSLWQLPDRVMLGVFNYDRKQAKDVTLSLDLAKLGLAARDGFDLAARDLFRPEGAAGVAFDAASGTVTLKGVGSHTLRLVGVRATDKSALARATRQLASLGNAAPAEFPAAVLDHNLITAKTTFAAPGQMPEIQPSDGIQVAAWRQPDRLLLAVINPGDQPKDAVLKVDLDALGLTPKLVWQEFIGVRDLLKSEQDPAATLDFYGRTLTLKDLPPKVVRLVGIRKY